MCDFCPSEKLTRQLSVDNSIVIELCQECFQSLQYKFIEVCTTCKSIMLVSTDKKLETPKAIYCPCCICMVERSLYAS